jgi:hypothetical protein
MSKERKDRRDEKLGIKPASRNWGRTAAYALLIVAAFALAYYLGNRTQHKHDDFARCLADRGVKMYGAWWCPHCQEQKEKFGASFEYAPYVECGIKGDLKGVAQACKDADIHHYPTWQFPPTGERVERVFTLEELSDRTGCTLP